MVIATTWQYISGGKKWMDSSFVGVVTTPKAPPMCMVGRVNELWIQ